MKKFFFLLIIIFLTNCSKPKTVLICGDHICVNKSEAEQFFKENLSIEVKIIDKKAKNEINLVELNLKENQQGIRKVNLSSKKEKLNKKEDFSKVVYKKHEDVFDVCTILEKCSIDQISKYLLNQGKKKGFPDITRRQFN